MKQINIAESVLAQRRAAGLTQDDLANRLGVSKAAVSKWETGLSYPDISLLPRLAAFFGITIDELMGYSPQLSKNEIRALYQRLAKAFAIQPFEAVIAEVDEIIADYYSCYPLLLQMAVLLANHHTMAADAETGQRLIDQAIALCQRIKANSDDVSLTRRANSMQAGLAMMAGRPDDVIDLLSDMTEHFASQEEVLLASAYEMTGQTEQAKRTLQISDYRNIQFLMTSATLLLRLYQDDDDHFEAVLHRGQAVAETYDLAHLHPNSLIQFTASAAVCLTQRGELERAVEMLRHSLAAYQNFTFPLLLHGDTYFDLLDDLFSELDLGADAPRDASLVQQSFLAMFTNPVFEPLFERLDYKNLVAEVGRHVG